MTEELSEPPVPPTVLDADDWRQTADRSETLLRLPAMSIRGRTLQYEDCRSRRLLSECTDGAIDHSVRFFAVTTVDFEPSLPPGTTPSMVAPTLRSEARRKFANRLDEKGLTNVQKARSERLRLPNGKRVRAYGYDAIDPLERVSEHQLALECWIVVWNSAGSVRIVTGGYPNTSLDSQLELDSEEPPLTRSQSSYREAFFSLLRGVATAEDT